MRHIREQLTAAEGRFVDKSAAYDAVVAAFKAEYGWPSDLPAISGRRTRSAFGTVLSSPPPCRPVAAHC
jgi:hypothetical protein